jgi:hypothetical protein
MSFKTPEDNQRLASKLVGALVKVARYVCAVDGYKVIHYMILRNLEK